MESGMVLVALATIGVVGCVTTVAILFGSLKLKADKASIDLEASHQESREVARKPSNKTSTKS